MKLKVCKTIRMFSRIFVVQAIFCSFAFANDGYTQSMKDIYLEIDQLQQAKVLDIFKEIEVQSMFKFSYDEKDVIKETRFYIKQGRHSVYSLLEEVSKKASLNFKRINNVISVTIRPKKEIPKIIETTVQQSISGIVTGASDGVPLPGVNVLVLGTTTGTQTDFDGNYTISASEGDVLVFSYLGTKSQSIAVGSSSTINVALAEDSNQLDEVVVTAFGIERKKKALAYSAQALDDDELNSAREVNIANYLTGKIAGVQVSNSSSGTGGSSNVTIRGNSSLTGSNQPLYVVDGVPIINRGNANPNSGLSGENDYGDGISSINPDDVKSISVLKGPAASALYGSRGANGVIVITTKSGKSQRGIGVEYNSTTSIETINLLPTYQNKYATGYEGTNIYGGSETIDGTVYETLPAWHWDAWGAPLDGRRVVSDPFLLPGESPRTLALVAQPEDNIKDFYETGVITNNMIALSGGGENTNARLSIGNTTTKGIIPNSSGTRNTINLRVNSKLTDKLSIDAKVNYSVSKFKNRPYLGANFDNVVLTLSTLGRYVPLDFLKKYYEETGEPGNFPGVQTNPYYVINELKNNDERNRMIAFASLKYEFNDWLSLSVKSGMDWYTDERKKIWPVGARGNVLGRFIETNISAREWNSDFLLTATNDITNDFSTSFSVGGNLLQQYNAIMQWDARDLKVEDLYQISNAQDVRPSSSLREKEIQSLFFMGQFAYKNYLFLDITGRNDWSSTLGVDNYSFFYPSAGLSLVFSDAFNIDSDIFTFGKLRASWAQVGNDSDPYLTTAGFTSYTTTYNGQGYASMSSFLPNLDLKNELTESIELGFDIRLFKNRFGLDVTYYDGNTKDQIIPIQISNSSGFQQAVINAGEIKNSGLEVVLNAGIIRKENGFNWNMAFNFSNNKSEVVALAPDIETFLLVDTFPNAIEARVGEEFGNIIGYKYQLSPDGRRIVGPGGNYTREAEKSILGNINPDWVGGLHNSFEYKGFFLNVLVDFVQGGEISSGTKYRATAGGFGKFTEEGRRPRDSDNSGDQLPYVGVLDGVVEILDGGGNVTGYEENTTAVDGQTYWATRAWSEIGEEFVLDASYITLREAIIGYNFNPSFLKNTGINSLRVSLIGRNLFYFEEHMQGLGISPESAPNIAAGARGIEQISMPTTRTWGVNLNITF